MKCQILFPGKNKKNISKCRLLEILPRVLSVKNVRFVPTYILLGFYYQDTPMYNIYL